MSLGLVRPAAGGAFLGFAGFCCLVDGWIFGMSSVGDVPLFLVRHGESEWNLAGRVQGQAVEAGGLTQFGRTQAERAASSLAGCGALSVVSSDLTRARETAEIIAGRLRLSVSFDAELREQDFGVYQGKTVADGSWFDQLWVDPFRRPVGGETVAELYARVHRALRRYAESPAIIVAHGGVVRAAMAPQPPAPGRSMDRGAVGNGSVHVWRPAAR